MLSTAFVILENFVQFQLDHDAPYLLGKETWAVLISENDVYQKLLKACEEKKSHIDWKHKAIENIASYLRCSRCHSLLLNPVDTSDDIGELEFLCSACNNRDSYSDIIEEAADACYGLTYRDIKDLSINN